MIEHVITGMVLHKPLTGYELKKEVESGIGNFYKASYGSLYPALKKLTDKGYVTLTEQTQVARLKKYYMATEAGKTAFLEWLMAPVDIGSGTAAILAKIYFFGELPKTMRNQKIQEYESAVQTVLDQYKNMEAQLADTIKNDRDYFELSTLYYGLQHTQGLLRWLKYIKTQESLTAFLQEN